MHGADYRAYLASFPGDWLADIYEQFGSRLLEKNVRSFLQFTGKVNRGMRDTISTDPVRFFAYNNGISATASSVELATLPDGSRGIVRLLDLQLVNGGQTTASLHRCRRSKIDVSSIVVQAKITEIDGDRLDEIVPLISQFANSQNKVSLADLSSNDPLHIEIESLSRSVWAEPTEKTMRQTRWFYERARRACADALAREGTPARRRTFREVHPTSQKVTKTDLAKFENTWAQRPWEVSQGAQKNFTAFMLALHRRGPVQPDVAYFQRLVAKAILFRRAERIVSAQDSGVIEQTSSPTRWQSSRMQRSNGSTWERFGRPKSWTKRSRPRLESCPIWHSASLRQRSGQLRTSPSGPNARLAGRRCKRSLGRSRMS